MDGLALMVSRAVLFSVIREYIVASRVGDGTLSYVETAALSADQAAESSTSHIWAKLEEATKDQMIQWGQVVQVAIAADDMPPPSELATLEPMPIVPLNESEMIAFPQRDLIIDVWQAHDLRMRFDALLKREDAPSPSKIKLRLIERNGTLFTQEVNKPQNGLVAVGRGGGEIIEYQGERPEEEPDAAAKEPAVAADGPFADLFPMT
jgi:hypothetical protein